MGRCSVVFYFGYATVIFFFRDGWLHGLEPHQYKSKRQMPSLVSVNLGLPYIWHTGDQSSRSGREKHCGRVERVESRSRVASASILVRIGVISVDVAIMIGDGSGPFVYIYAVLIIDTRWHLAPGCWHFTA
jgi:hypothetical protein